MLAQDTRPISYRLSVLGYGVLAYLAFLITVLYYIAFLVNLGAGIGIDKGPMVPLSQAVAIDIGLIALFGLQHSVMARSWFKGRWTQVIPEPIERSTFVLCSATVLLVIAWIWRPLPMAIWAFDGPARWILWGVYGLGFVIVVLSTFQISHSRFFGLQQVLDYYRGRDTDPPPFQTSGFYQYVRHPMMTGILLWFWATPNMTVGHLLFAGGFTIYILGGTQLEEQMLLDVHGKAYREYRRRVPRFFPRPGTSVDSISEDTGNEKE